MHPPPGETQLTVLLDELLNLKTQLLQDNEGIVDGRDQTSTTGATSLQGKNDDEEVDSDIAEGIDSDHDPGERDEDEGGGDSVNHKHSRKRAGRPWVSGASSTVGVVQWVSGGCGTVGEWWAGYSG